LKEGVEIQPEGKDKKRGLRVSRVVTSEEKKRKRKVMDCKADNQRNGEKKKKKKKKLDTTFCSTNVRPPLEKRKGGKRDRCAHIVPEAKEKAELIACVAEERRSSVHTKGKYNS